MCPGRCERSYAALDVLRVMVLLVLARMLCRCRSLSRGRGFWIGLYLRRMLHRCASVHRLCQRRYRIGSHVLGMLQDMLSLVVIASASLLVHRASGVCGFLGQRWLEVLVWRLLATTPWKMRW